MKKINLKGISEILSEKELKNVMGGSGFSPYSGWTWECECYAQVGDWNCWESNPFNCGGDTYCNKGYSCYRAYW